MTGPNLPAKPDKSEWALDKSLIGDGREHYLGSGQGRAWETDMGLRQLREWAENGLSYKQVATNIGIAETTLSNWRKGSPLIEHALNLGRQKADIEVTNALFKNAVGSELEEVREETRVDADGNVESKVVRTKRQQKGDTNAQIFWLKNRAEDAWRDRQAPTHQTVNIGDANKEMVKYLYLSDDNFLVKDDNEGNEVGDAERTD